MAQRVFRNSQDLLGHVGGSRVAIPSWLNVGLHQLVTRFCVDRSQPALDVPVLRCGGMCVCAPYKWFCAQPQDTRRRDPLFFSSVFL